MPRVQFVVSWTLFLFALVYSFNKALPKTLNLLIADIDDRLVSRNNGSFIYMLLLSVHCIVSAMYMIGIVFLMIFAFCMILIISSKHLSLKMKKWILKAFDPLVAMQALGSASHRIHFDVLCTTFISLIIIPITLLVSAKDYSSAEDDVTRLHYKFTLFIANAVINMVIMYIVYIIMGLFKG